MSQQVNLIKRRLVHLDRMAGYLKWSHQQVMPILKATDWNCLTQEQHEALAAFRVRFSEFQEHLGKTMRAIAIEEEESPEPFGAVLSFMEKLNILDTVEHWKIIRELRNSVNHEYEDDPQRIYDFFQMLVEETPTLISYFHNMRDYCDRAYPA